MCLHKNLTNDVVLTDSLFTVKTTSLIYITEVHLLIWYKMFSHSKSCYQMELLMLSYRFLW